MIPREIAFSLSFGTFMPAPSSLMAIFTLPAWWKACSTIVPVAGFLARQGFGRLNPMIDRIADQVS